MPSSATPPSRRGRERPSHRTDLRTVGGSAPCHRAGRGTDKHPPPKALLERLSDRLKLLTGGPREFSERQRTLRSTIEWSYELLEEGEKALFGRLSVFSGGATLEATEAVCDALGDLSLDAPRAPPRCWRRACWDRRKGQGRAALGDAGDHPRVREERLEESGEVEEIKRVHAQYFLTLAEEACQNSMAQIKLSGWRA